MKLCNNSCPIFNRKITMQNRSLIISIIVIVVLICCCCFAIFIGVGKYLFDMPERIQLQNMPIQTETSPSSEENGGLLSEPSTLTISIDTKTDDVDEISVVSKTVTGYLKENAQGKQGYIEAILLLKNSQPNSYLTFNAYLYDSNNNFLILRKGQSLIVAPKVGQTYPAMATFYFQDIKNVKFKNDNFKIIVKDFKVEPFENAPQEISESIVVSDQKTERTKISLYENTISDIITGTITNKSDQEISDVTLTILSKNKDGITGLCISPLSTLQASQTDTFSCEISYKRFGKDIWNISLPNTWGEQELVYFIDAYNYNQ